MVEFSLSLVTGLRYVGAGMATTGVIGAGIGIGILFGCFVLAVSRNPFLEQRLLRTVFLGFALVEAMGLLAIVMAFLILYI